MKAGELLHTRLPVRGRLSLQEQAELALLPTSALFVLSCRSSSITPEFTTVKNYSQFYFHILQKHGAHRCITKEPEEARPSVTRQKEPSVGPVLPRQHEDK